MAIERRFTKAELRADSQGDEMALVGYAAVFGMESEDLGGFREMVMPGAFARSLREGADVRCLMNHDPNLVLGRSTNGTLQMKEDARGLYFRVVLPNTTAAHDLHALVKRGDVDQCSFAFTVKSQEWLDQKDTAGELYAQRRLHDVDLMDCSAVTYPAYRQTSINARAEAVRTSTPNEFFLDGAPVEVRSAISAVAVKRGIQSEAPNAQNGGLPTDEDIREKWVKAFEDAYKDAIKKEHKKPAEAVACGIAAANMAIHDSIAHTPDPSHDGATADSKQREQVDDDADGKVYSDSDEDERALTAAIESRIYKSASEVPDYVPADKKKQWMEVWNSVYKKAIKDGKSKKAAEASAFKQANGVAGPNAGEKNSVRCKFCEARVSVSNKDGGDEDECEDGDCEDATCWCQNQMVHPSEAEAYSMDDECEEDRAQRENRAGKVRTKKVGGKNLTKDKFAFVGDPERTETWKLPIHDASHVRNALARFNQTQGIPANKKASVWAKIKAAAKKFGIHVSEDDAMRCGVPFSEEEVADRLNRVRTIQIDNSL